VPIGHYTPSLAIGRRHGRAAKQEPAMNGKVAHLNILGSVFSSGTLGW
jgi:hypothetical protein